MTSTDRKNGSSWIWGWTRCEPPENHRIHRCCPAAPWSQRPWRSWVPCRGLQGPGERRPGRGSPSVGLTESARRMLPVTHSHSLALTHSLHIGSKSLVDDGRGTMMLLKHFFLAFTMEHNFFCTAFEPDTSDLQTF
jgi:hypothetical protein